MAKRGPTRVPASGVEWGNRVIERMSNDTNKIRLYRQNSGDVVIPGDGKKRATRRIIVGPDDGCADLTGNDCVTGVRLELEMKLPGDKVRDTQVAWSERMLAQNVLYLIMEYDATKTLGENLNAQEKRLRDALLRSRRTLGHARHGGAWSGLLEFEFDHEIGCFGLRGGGIWYDRPWAFAWTDTRMGLECTTEHHLDTPYALATRDFVTIDDGGVQLRLAWEFIVRHLEEA